MPATTTTFRSFTYFVSPATGRQYWIGSDGLAVREEDEGSDWVGCECEIDWNCGRCGRTGTWLETRYDGLED